jgi:hypothetical protein
MNILTKCNNAFQYSQTCIRETVLGICKSVSLIQVALLSRAELWLSRAELWLGKVTILNYFLDMT